MNIQQRPDNETRTQKEWIEFFNNIKQRMISAQDVFNLKDDNASLELLRKDFKDDWLVTSTQIQYNPNNLSATIIQNAGSTVTTPKETKLKCVPVYDDEKLTNILKTKEGVDFINALFGTNLNKKEIIDFLEKLSNKKASKIYIRTPSQSSRKDKPIRSVRLYFYIFFRFFVGGDSWYDDGDGYSHGVLSVSEPKARSKRRQSK